jgi:hypothetical protein
MALADHKGEWVIRLAEIQGKIIATSCPSTDNLSKAENILETKGRKRLFSIAKAENILKTSGLKNTMKIGIRGDKLFGQAERCVRRIRSSQGEGVRFRSPHPSRPGG